MKRQIKLNGNNFACHIIQSLKPRVLKHKDMFPPYLHIINVGDNPSSASYIKKKTQLADKIGILSHVHHFQFNYITHNEVSGQIVKTQSKYKQNKADADKANKVTKQIQKLIKHLNAQEDCTGILLQLPLPDCFDNQRLLNIISPLKDVDCLTEINRKQMMLNSQKAQILPCTPAAVLRILDHHEICVQSKKVTIIGRSKLVGTPLAFLLMSRNATVTVCHHLTRSQDIVNLAKQCDILISAAGAPNLIKDVRTEGVVIDIGITRIDENGKWKLVGDIEQKAKQNSSFYTPVPGGVGPLTVAMLMQNTVKMWQDQIQNKKRGK